MPLLKTVAESITTDDFVAGVVEEFIDREALYEYLPFTHTEGKAYVYTRELEPAEGAWLSPNEDIPESASDFQEVTTNLRILAGDVDVDKFLDETMSNKNSQKALQIAAKAKGMSRQFKRALVQGDNSTDPKQFDGIDKLVEATGNFDVVGANGAALSLDMLDELLAAVKNGADALMMRQGTLNALKTLWRAAGGNTGGMLQVNNFGLPVMGHDGTPILINDWIPGNVVQGTATETCSIYAVRFNEFDGLHGLYGGKTAGFRAEDLGTVQNRDATRTRLKFYCGLALKSTQSLAALRGITNI